jgi:hypothetical protein
MQQPAKSLEKSQRGPGDALAILGPSLELQHLWFRMAGQRRSQSLAVVPAELDVSTIAMVQGLAQVAGSMPESRVLVVNASLRDCLPARGPVPRPDIGLEDFALAADDGPLRNCDVVDLSRLPADDAERALLMAPQLMEHLERQGKRYTTVLFAIDSPLHQARVLPLVRSADAVVLALSLGRTTFEAARQLVELVGRERVLGAVTI